MITLTDTAAKKVKELVEAEGNNELALRVAVRPGGCSGFSYEMFFDSDFAADDQKADYDGVKVVVDSASLQYLERRLARLQGRADGGRVHRQQPQHHPVLRLRAVVLLRRRSVSSWMVVGSPDNFARTRDLGFSVQGFKSRQRKKVLEQMQPGDNLVYYVSTRCRPSGLPPGSRARATRTTR